MGTLNAYMEQVRSLARAEVYLVGGFVRDLLLGKESKDLNIVLKEDAVKIAKKFAYRNEGSVIILDELRGVARVVMKDHNISIDFAQMQGTDILEDISRRDFTMNAMALRIEEEGIFDIKNLIDIFEARKDLENKIIRMTGPEVFAQDPLRMLRAVRFMAELGFEIEESTAHRIRQESIKLKEVSGERISYELFKILKCHRTYHYFGIMDKQLDLLNKVFPEIEPMKDVGKCKYHVVDSWTHSLYTLKVAENIIYADGYFENHLRKAYEEHVHQMMASGHTRLELIKLAALFHDIGKPAARWVDETGRVRFRGHEIVGMEIVEEISDRLRLSTKEKKFLCKMVKEHMWPLTLYKQNDVSGKAIYGLFKNFGEDTLDVLLVSLADIIATRKLLYPHEEMGMYKVHIEYLANNYLTRFKDIVDISSILNGDEIMEAFQVDDLKQIGNMIDEVRKAIFFGKISPEKKSALAYLQEEKINSRV